MVIVRRERSQLSGRHREPRAATQLAQSSNAATGICVSHAIGRPHSDSGLVTWPPRLTGALPTSRLAQVVAVVWIGLTDHEALVVDARFVGGNHDRTSQLQHGT